MHSLHLSLPQTLTGVTLTAVTLLVSATPVAELSAKSTISSATPATPTPTAYALGNFKDEPGLYNSPIFDTVSRNYTTVTVADPTTNRIYNITYWVNSRSQAVHGDTPETPDSIPWVWRLQETGEEETSDIYEESAAHLRSVSPSFFVTVDGKISMNTNCVNVRNTGLSGKKLPSDGSMVLVDDEYYFS
ncbi:hypothetical protein K458DRAFT_390321 [Lentithecium fluviatile CBS 122367]|uniref:Uncharacterized protein n=1 Tax=Lentithecium fluviatile CBS 122367 TaxID=1168545 RepID=A0A6G1IYJ8_9PLEO|nr:hypothetical protein K458DRAFT_390321 [Lentithecium fluviatile CBS 122367]